MVDDECERLALEFPLVDPPIRPLGGIVVLVDLDMDEVHTLGLPLLRDRLNDLDNGATGSRLTVGRRCERDDEGPPRREGSRNCGAEELAVRRFGRRDGLRIDSRLQRRVTRRRGLVADCRRLRVPPHDEVAERLDRLAADGLGEHPVGTGLRRRHRRDVDVLSVGRRTARHADRLEARSRLHKRLLLEPV